MEFQSVLANWTTEGSKGMPLNGDPSTFQDFLNSSCWLSSVEVRLPANEIGTMLGTEVYPMTGTQSREYIVPFIF